MKLTSFGVHRPKGVIGHEHSDWRWWSSGSNHKLISMQETTKMQNIRSTVFHTITK